MTKVDHGKSKRASAQGSGMVQVEPNQPGQPYQRHADGTRSWEVKEEWFKGKHEPIIPEDIFNLCQEIRAAKAVHHEYYPKHRTYLLRDIIFCAHCVEHMAKDVQDDAYGKMRPHTNFHGRYLLYRCRARSWGRICPQGSVRADAVEDQVVTILKNLKPPEDWRKRMVVAMGQLLT
jgi:recombinase-like zinc beta ribbon protein